jgi:hypothetical protein
MDKAKHAYREGEARVKEAARDVDGHDIGDDVGNAGDQVRKGLGNAGDAVRRTADHVAEDVDREARKP